jgi:thymidylate synthase (FAD)
MVDVMDGDARREIKCLDHGFVALLDVMPRMVPRGQTGDAAIVQAARVSYGQGTKKVSEDRGLVRYLLRHRHTTPLEMVEFKFHVAMPIFVARQWIRHRTANVNEYSGRYSIMPDRFYRPTMENVRKQSASNRQGGEQRFLTDTEAAPDEAKTAAEFLAFLDKTEKLYQEYLSLSERGVSRELARIGLPVSLYTEWYWKCDLHNTLRFLSLRMDAHAQEEIRVFAQAMYDLIAPIVPFTIEAWRDYELDAMHLTRLEIDAIRRMREERADSHGRAGGDAPGTSPTLQPIVVSENKREQAEWEAKRARLGL